MLGREILDLAGGKFAIRSTDVGELDVTRPEDCRRAIGEFAPDVVVHCAAYTAVDRAESEENLAFALNAEGTRNVARACREHGALLVTFGTDYVFDGTSDVPYREEDEPHPLSAYGRSKLAAEKAMMEESPRHLLLRTQWLYGAHGRNFIFAILDKARKGEALRVVSDQRGTPTNARDLSEAAVRLIEAGATGTFHFSNEGETSWFEFARHILDRSFRKPVFLSPALSAELAYPARRPAYAVLSKEKYRRTTGESPRRWVEAVEEFLKAASGREG